MRLSHVYGIELKGATDYVNLTVNDENYTTSADITLELTPLQAEALVASLTEFVGSKEDFK